MSETHEQYQARLLAEFKRILSGPEPWPEVRTPAGRLDLARISVEMMEGARVEALTNVEGDGI